MAAAAPTVLEAAPVTPAPAAAPAAKPAGAVGFDAILLLQSLAATGETLDTAHLEADDTADLLATEDSTDDDETGEDLEASLAFLSALLTATTPRQSPGDFQAGSQGQGAPDEDATPLPASGKDPAFAFNPAAIVTSDAETGAAAPMLAAVIPEPLEQRHAAGDAAQNLARAAEMLAPAPRAAVAAAEASGIGTHVRDPRWADDFSARVSLLVRAGESTASLQLTPVDLGPVEVNVTVKDSQATIHFGAAQAETRQLLEASLPRLRELLAAQGFSLLDASVSSGFSRSQHSAETPGVDRGRGETDAVSTDAISVRHSGLLDLYA